MGALFRPKPKVVIDDLHCKSYNLMPHRYLYLPLMKKLKPFNVLTTAGVLLTLLVLVVSCGFNDLPPTTKKGANTMGCKVNGKSWVAKDVLFGKGKPTGGYSGATGAFYLRGLNAGEEDLIHISMRMQGTYGQGKYHFNSNPYVPGQDVNFGSRADCSIRIGGTTSYYITDAQHSGRITFTRFDVGSQIYSGTFEFTAVNTADSTDRVRITKGRFDIGPK
jgi:hypothetical protein